MNQQIGAKNIRLEYQIRSSKVSELELSVGRTGKQSEWIYHGDQRAMTGSELKLVNTTRARWIMSFLQRLANYDWHQQANCELELDLVKLQTW